MRYDRARKDLDRHPNHILAAYMASGTWPTLAALPMTAHLIVPTSREVLW